MKIDFEKEAKPMENMKTGLLRMIRGPGTFPKKGGGKNWKKWKNSNLQQHLAEIS